MKCFQIFTLTVEVLFIFLCLVVVESDAHCDTDKIRWKKNTDSIIIIMNKNQKFITKLLTQCHGTWPMYYLHS
jgi:ascorbate-specific PTS system EIIC-type component UlaA